MKKGFENLNTNFVMQLSPAEARKWKVKQLAKKALWVTVGALVIMGGAYLIGTHLDTLSFAMTNPTAVRKAIQLHNKATELGASASAQLEDGAYSYSVR